MRLARDETPWPAEIEESALARALELQALRRDALRWRKVVAHINLDHDYDGGDSELWSLRTPSDDRMPGTALYFEFCVDKLP